MLAIAQSLEERHNSVFFGRREPEVAKFRSVEIRRGLRCWPWHHVTGVVEMDYRIEALEVAVVAIGLHEPGVRALVDVAQRGNLELTIVRRSQRRPRACCRQEAAE